MGDSLCWRASVQRCRMRRETDPAGFTVPAEREVESKCTASEEQWERGVGGGGYTSSPRAGEWHSAQQLPPTLTGRIQVLTQKNEK